MNSSKQNNANGERKMNMTQTISQIAKRDVEITIRGDREFTFSFDDADHAAANRIKSFFGNTATVEIDVDDELGTCVYVSIH